MTGNVWSLLTVVSIHFQKGLVVLVSCADEVSIHLESAVLQGLLVGTVANLAIRAAVSIGGVSLVLLFSRNRNDLFHYSCIRTWWQMVILAGWGRCAVVLNYQDTARLSSSVGAFVLRRTS